MHGHIQLPQKAMIIPIMSYDFLTMLLPTKTENLKTVTLQLVAQHSEGKT